MPTGFTGAVASLAQIVRAVACQVTTLLRPVSSTGDQTNKAGKTVLGLLLQPFRQSRHMLPPNAPLRPTPVKVLGRLSPGSVLS
eukprot:5872213-Pyramimonas_sp.AAC.1